MEQLLELDKNTIVLVGGAILVAMAVIAAKHKRGLAAAASFGVLVVVFGLKYYTERCEPGKVKIWTTCVPEHQVKDTRPFRG